MPSELRATPYDILADLWALAGGEPSALSDVTLTGREPALPSSFRVGAVAQATIAATALAAAQLWRQRTGRRQTVSVNMRHAAVEFRSERYQRIADRPPGPTWDKIAGVYETGDARKVRLHTNFPHHRDGILKLLGVAYERAAVAAALKRWQAQAFEDAVAAAGLVATMLRAPAEWADHPQGRAVAALPLFEISKIGEAPARALARNPARPLAGVRVLDLTRVIAGPVCGRALAAHGADVMRVTAPHLPGFAGLDVDTGRGKLATALDLRAEDDRDRLTGLLREAHIFVQGYRPGGLAAFGFSPEACAEVRPGIIAVTLSAYGHAGPWAGRRGFDSLVQNASGINVAEAEAAGVPPPRELPAQALDHASGYLMAFAAMLALARKAKEGGSWHVRVSLAQTGHWLGNLGRLSDGFAAADPKLADIGDLIAVADTPFGRVSHVRHAGVLAETPPYWARPAVPLGTHAPVWPA